jgi:hypothetical protein
MSTSHGNGRSHTSVDGQDNGQGHESSRIITVHCPNPECGKAHTCESRYIGKRGKCQTCGTIIPIREAGHSSPSASKADPDSGRQQDGRPEVEQQDGPAVRVGCIGRGHAGKTALFHALGEGLVGDFLPSGLHIDASDPREVARMIRENDETLRLLHACGLPPTLQASQMHYCLYAGEKRLVAYRLREVIGQVLSHTLPDSSPDLQARYDEYLKSLQNTHVLWAVVPCPPPEADSADHRRYANDLHIALAYLREALRLRTPEQPAAVALVLSKIDAPFETADQARDALTDEVLRNSLGPLVHLVEQSANVSDAVIVPTSALGFGNAVRRESGADRHEAPPESADDPFGSEPIWLLREGTSASPFNLDTLFLWTLLLGLLRQAGPGAETDGEVAGVCRMLGEDLEAGDPWLVPLKGEIVLPAAGRERLTHV